MGQSFLITVEAVEICQVLMTAGIGLKQFWDPLRNYERDLSFITFKYITLAIRIITFWKIYIV